MQDFARRRKLLVVVGVVFGLALIFYFYTVSYRNNSPGDIDVQVSNNAASSLLNKERTSVDTDKPERVKDPPLEEQLKNTPLNKGNIAQAVNELHQVGEGESKGSDYPEHGVEIKPEVGGGHKKSGEHDEKKASKEKKKEGAELEPKTGGKPDSKSDKLVPKSLKDSEIPVKPKSIGVQRLPPQDTVSHSDGAGSYVTDKPQSTDNLYVHSSMPLGPALKIQHTERQKAVVEAFKHAWSNYKKYAWGEDDLRPLSKSHSSVDYGMAMTMIDSLDTLWLLGLQEEFNEARDWVANHLRFDNNPRKVVVFEVNIRVLGGLLSAYHLSGDVMFLAKAVSSLMCLVSCQFFILCTWSLFSFLNH